MKRGIQGFAAGALTLVAMQVLGTARGAQQGGKLLVWLTGGIRRALAADVPAIPRVGKATAGSSGKSKSKSNDTEIGGVLPRNPPVQV
ncbi:hypothetical protein C5N14_30930 [Micromonospora sp. MW-13]|uniref:hypothetical protein n=1 Tax=Micromonospora sp. MW-13 TaxID=2094022 RepID=UPI000E4442FE|nr:hypothetical protein [Micromonospora sp. MW-13]RGC65008.1 hypothetical protein C5N14_30930 [Micromonospora sp. MW-13]